MTAIKDLYNTALELKRNEFLKTKGTLDTNIYYIESGSLKIFMTEDGDEQIIRFGYKNDLIVSLDSFLTEKPSEFCIQALKKTTVKVISKKSFEEYINLNDANRKEWIAILENLILQQSEREIDLLTPSPAARFKRVLSRSPQLFQEIPNKHIANYLRMTPETLSRLKKS